MLQVYFCIILGKVLKLSKHLCPHLSNWGGLISIIGHCGEYMRSVTHKSLAQGLHTATAPHMLIPLHSFCNSLFLDLKHKLHSGEGLLKFEDCLLVSRSQTKVGL